MERARGRENDAFVSTTRKKAKKYYEEDKKRYFDRHAAEKIAEVGGRSLTESETKEVMKIAKTKASRRTKDWLNEKVARRVRELEQEKASLKEKNADLEEEQTRLKHTLEQARIMAVIDAQIMGESPVI